MKFFATLVFDKFHVVAQMNGAVDEVRRTEALEGDAAAKVQLKRAFDGGAKNPENLTVKQQARMT